MRKAALLVSLAFLLLNSRPAGACKVIFDSLHIGPPAGSTLPPNPVLLVETRGAATSFKVEVRDKKGRLVESRLKPSCPGGLSGCRALELAGVTSGRIIVSTKWGGNAWEHREYTIDPTWTADASFVPARCEAEAAASTLTPASQRLQHSILQFRPRRVPAGLMIVKTDASGVKSRDREIVRHGMKIQGRVRFHWVSASTSLAVTPLWPDGSAGPTWKGKAGVAKGPWSEDPADYITGIWSGEASPVKCSGRSIAAKER